MSSVLYIHCIRCVYMYVDISTVLELLALFSIHLETTMTISNASSGVCLFPSLFSVYKKINSLNKIRLHIHDVRTLHTIRLSSIVFSLCAHFLRALSFSGKVFNDVTWCEWKPCVCLCVSLSLELERSFSFAFIRVTYQEWISSVAQPKPPFAAADSSCSKVDGLHF